MSSVGTHHLTDRLVEDLRPVRRIWSPGARTATWLALEGVVLVCLVATGLRGDGATLVTMPSFLIEFTALVVAAALLALLAFRAAVPGEEVSGLVRFLAALCAALAAAHVASLPLGMDQTLGDFVHKGWGCAIRTTVLAVLPWDVILLAVGRGAPLRGAITGALAGAAAFVMAFALMRVHCPIDEMLHLLAWHGAPVLAAAGVSGVIGLLWLPRWRRRRV
jgi:hypothetical protein